VRCYHRSIRGIAFHKKPRGYVLSPWSTTRKLPIHVVRNVILFLKEQNTPLLSPDASLNIVGPEYNISRHRWIINITHTSSFFRTIALDCRDLWTDIPLYSQELTTLFLERSRSTSQLTWLIDEKLLAFLVQQNTVIIDCLLNLVNLTNMYLPHISVFHLRMPARFLLFFLPMLNAHAPSLQELHLINTGGRKPTQPHVKVETCLSDTFKNHISGLQVLNLCGFDIGAESIPSSTNLKSLRIGFKGCSDPAHMPSIVSLLA
jgi:hypothetical protein